MHDGTVKTGAPQSWVRRLIVVGLVVLVVAVVGVNLIASAPEPTGALEQDWRQGDPDRLAALPPVSGTGAGDAGGGEGSAGFFESDEIEPGSDTVGLDGPYDCLIEPKRVVKLASALSAVVSKVHVERSDRVQANQVVVELESDVERAAVDVAEARAGMAGSVRARRASLELGESRKQRASHLLRSAVVSADVAQEAETEAKLARAELEQAEDLQDLWELQVVEARERLDRRVLRSPITGVVVERHKSAGEIAKEETLLTIAQIDPLRVQVIVPAAAFRHIQSGMRAEVHPELPEVGVQVAAVEIIDRVIDPTSGTFGVWLELPNADQSIPSGLRCQVQFMGGQEVASTASAGVR